MDNIWNFDGQLELFVNVLLMGNIKPRWNCHFNGDDDDDDHDDDDDDDDDDQLILAWFQDVYGRGQWWETWLDLGVCCNPIRHIFRVSNENLIISWFLMTLWWFDDHRNHMVISWRWLAVGLPGTSALFGPSMLTGPWSQRCWKWPWGYSHQVILGVIIRISQNQSESVRIMTYHDISWHIMTYHGIFRYILAIIKIKMMEIVTIRDVMTQLGQLGMWLDY